VANRTTFLRVRKSGGSPLAVRAMRGGRGAWRQQLQTFSMLLAAGGAASLGRSVCPGHNMCAAVEWLTISGPKLESSSPLKPPDLTWLGDQHTN
jgi:hypothetical protein